MRRWIGENADWRYLLLAGVVLALAVSQATNNRWSGDFYLHAAVVEELADHPLDPANPTQSSDTPNADISPYTLAVGLGARVAATDSSTALAGASIINVLAVLALLAPVIRRFTGSRRAPFWALLATLVWWGPDPLAFSGYLNLNSLVLVSPYPSVFATAGVLLAALAAFCLTEGGGRRWDAVLALTGAAVVISHPLSAMAGACVVGAILTSARQTVQWHRLAVDAGVAIGLVALWPYYPVSGLVGGVSDLDTFHNQLYAGLLRWTWPLLVAALPLLALRVRRVGFDDALVLWAGSTTAVFAAGWVLDFPTLGRIFPFVALAGSALLAWGLSELEAWHPATDRGRVVRATAWAGVGAMAVFGTVNVWEGVRLASPEQLVGSRDPEFGARPQEAYSMFSLVGEDGVVMVDGFPAVYVPLFTGRPVASLWTERFSPTDEQRRDDIERFFATDATAAERTAIVDRWGVTHVVADEATPDAAAVTAWLREVGATELARETGLTLWSLPG